VNCSREKLLIIGFFLIISAITTLCITGQYVYAIREHTIHNQIHVPSDIVKESIHLSQIPLHSSNALGGSPGTLSGNVVQVPIHVPINACGDTVDNIGILNPSFGNTCINSK
jgi:hypothetical protein